MKTSTGVEIPCTEGQVTTRLYGSTKTVSGGAGNDTYYVDGTSEQIIEASGEGTDHVVLTNFFGGNSYTLQANVENLTLRHGSVSATWARTSFRWMAPATR